MDKKNHFVLISAGGTGGHMSPAAALADDLKSRGYRVELVTDNRGKKFEKMFKVSLGGVKEQIILTANDYK